MHRVREHHIPEVIAPLHLSAAEGYAITVLDALLGVGALRERIQVRALPADSGRDLILAGASRMRVAAMRFLVDSGGRREVTVLRGGKRVTGRIWDEAIQNGFSLRFTRSTAAFWPEVARALIELRSGESRTVSRAVDDKATRKHRKVLRELFTTHTLGATGDWIFFALVRRNLAVLRLDAEDSASLSRRMYDASPLLSLLFLDEQASEDELRTRFTHLVDPSAVLILESVRDRITEAWAGHAESTWSGRSQASVFITRADALARTARALISAANEAHRMDVTLPVAAFGAQLVSRILPRGDQTRSGIAWLRGITTLAQRDEVLRALRGIVEIPADLLRHRAILASEGYGYERYEEAQLFVRGIDQILSPHRALIDELQRAMSDTLG